MPRACRSRPRPSAGCTLQHPRRVWSSNVGAPAGRAATAVVSSMAQRKKTSPGHSYKPKTVAARTLGSRMTARISNSSARVNLRQSPVTSNRIRVFSPALSTSLLMLAGLEFRPATAVRYLWQLVQTAFTLLSSLRIRLAKFNSLRRPRQHPTSRLASIHRQYPHKPARRRVSR